MTFSRPWWLLAVIAIVAVFGCVYQFALRRRAAQGLLYSNLPFMLAALRPSRLPSALLFAGWLGGIALLALPLAAPRVALRVPVKEGVVILCIDTSGSMRAHDISPSRAQAAKAAARAFMEEVPPGTRVGVVAFSTDAALIQTPSADLEAVRDALERLPAPNGATAIGDALELAGEQMPPKGHRVVVLLTDGVNNRGSDPLQAAQLLGSRGISIYTIGIGTSASNERIPGTDELADLDAQSLEAIAQNAGGAYASAPDAPALRRVFSTLARETVWESRQVDASLAAALSGGTMVTLTFLAGLLAGIRP